MPKVRRARRPNPNPVFSPALTLGALGVVFGDIGTSPLYTIATCFSMGHASATPDDVLGIISLVAWTLVIVVCVKYVGVITKIDHDGEGGILALLALVAPGKVKGIPAKPKWVTIVVIIGCGMLFGDGAITPAISVISAVEGLDVATTAAHPYIVPVSVAILIGLFAIQSRGTDQVGRLFGPVMVLWFLAIGALGIGAIVRTPQGLWALDPRHGLGFIVHHGVFGFFVFGGVVLAITGVEALYADLSHFGRPPIFAAWYVLVFPTLILNYLGQGSIVLAAHKVPDSPFYAMAPGPMLIPLVVLATAATVIASQALISGVFTLAEQAINLSMLPRMRVRHTSAAVHGQVYVPLMNGLLAAACVALVIAFKSSAALAAAYGLAVSTTMLATDVVFYQVVVHHFHWRRRLALPLVACFFTIDGTFVAAGLPKFLDGAWVPFVIAAFFVATALTWLIGRRRMAEDVARVHMPIDQYLTDVAPTDGEPSGTMVFLTPDPGHVPFVDSKHRWVRSRAREERLILMTLAPTRHPYVTDGSRVKIEKRSERLTIVRGTFGFMERPSIQPILDACKELNLHIDSDDTSFFYADPKIVRAHTSALPRWVRKYFEFLNRNAFPLPDDLQIPAERRVELGVEVAI